MDDPSPDAAPSDGAAEPEKQRGRGARRAGRLGRRVALILWAVGMLYMVVVGFVTVIPQVFFEEPEGVDAQAEFAAGDCGDTAERLTGMLLERGGEHVAEARPAGTLGPFFRRWDARYFAYLRHCGESETSAELARLRYRLELTLRRFDREEGAIVRKLDELASD